MGTTYFNTGRISQRYNSIKINFKHPTRTKLEVFQLFDISQFTNIYKNAKRHSNQPL